ncbi:lipase family alpha/beta hydrolase [Phocoenobacter skyensis]|uniref:lipase family alpha/beta hydrolase n=1 Tax=Phocoenobacter skyensis TaxID=97481 RepID=UPI00274FA148|nr:hypothetical protein [Pasteurella skyensis]MDP8185969.1 hypothetical protein [Pasteurella skyensis]
MKQPKLFLIHGLFMNSIIMQYMRYHLSRSGYDVQLFSYPSTRRSLQYNAEQLLDFVKQQCQQEEICHFVGHSLGGLLIRLGYNYAPQYFNGRIVTLGTPHKGSEVAQHIADHIPFNILGHSYKNALDGHLPLWQGNIELGSIAGTKCIGIGSIFQELDKPNDGTVSLAETMLENQTDHIELPLSHTTLLYSKQVIYQTDYFLKNGRFDKHLV